MSHKHDRIFTIIMQQNLAKIIYYYATVFSLVNHINGMDIRKSTAKHNMCYIIIQ